MKTLIELARDLEAGRTRARALVEECLGRIVDKSGEGGRVFLSVNVEAARADADYWDAQRKRGRAPSPFAGIPISYKDLFDVAGEVTRAGSTILADRDPAPADCPAVARMRAAGFVQVGRTNMTEFAFSGVGINLHYDTPRNAYDRATGRVPGGSSSGAAVSITDGMAAIALGTDTGGSCRIPAAVNGVVGYKPTAWRVPTEGAYPLSFSLDSIGPLGNSVACCAAVDALLAGDWSGVPVERPASGLRLGALQSYVLDGLDEEVAVAYERAVTALSQAGAHVEDVRLDELLELPQLSAKGGIAAAEAYAWHKDMLERDYARYDPRIANRILLGKEQSAADYIGLLTARSRIGEAADAVSAPFDALVLPTCAIVAPPIAAFDEDGDYVRHNMMLLRNTAVGNFLDRCAISLPCHVPGEAPVGFMLFGEHGGDEDLFSVALAVERVLEAARKA